MKKILKNYLDETYFVKEICGKNFSPKNKIEFCFIKNNYILWFITYKHLNKKWL